MQFTSRHELFLCQLFSATRARSHTLSLNFIFKVITGVSHYCLHESRLFYSWHWLAFKDKVSFNYLQTFMCRKRAAFQLSALDIRGAAPPARARVSRKTWSCFFFFLFFPPPQSHLRQPRIRRSELQIKLSSLISVQATYSHCLYVLIHPLKMDW